MKNKLRFKNKDINVEVINEGDLNIFEAFEMFEVILKAMTFSDEVIQNGVEDLAVKKGIINK